MLRIAQRRKGGQGLSWRVGIGSSLAQDFVQTVRNLSHKVAQSRKGREEDLKIIKSSVFLLLCRKTLCVLGALARDILSHKAAKAAKGGIQKFILLHEDRQSGTAGLKLLVAGNYQL